MSGEERSGVRFGAFSAARGGFARAFVQEAGSATVRESENSFPRLALRFGTSVFEA